MAGLSVILETQNPFPKCPQIISKTNLLTTRRKSFSSHNTQPSRFLEHCYLCHQRLSEGKDIYMYRGDRAFCSEECRCKQILMDEESGNRDSCSFAAASVRRRQSQSFAGGFA